MARARAERVDPRGPGLPVERRGRAPLYPSLSAVRAAAHFAARRRAHGSPARPARAPHPRDAARARRDDARYARGVFVCARVCVCVCVCVRACVGVRRVPILLEAARHGGEFDGDARRRV